MRTHRRPHDLAVERVDAAGREEDLVGAGRGGGAQESAGVAGVLHAVQNEGERGGGRQGQLRYGDHGHDALRRYGLANLVENGGWYQVERTGLLELRRKIRLRLRGGGSDETGVEGGAHGQGVLHQARSFQRTEAMGLSVAAAVQLGRQFDLGIAGAGDLFHSAFWGAGSPKRITASTSGDRRASDAGGGQIGQKSRDVCLCNLHSELSDGQAAVATMRSSGEAVAN